MKKSLLLMVLCLIFALCILCSLVSCVQKNHTVYFDLSGGTGDIPPQEISHGEKVAKPQDPTREGYKFLGWYVGDEIWSFVGYSVTEDMTLTAKWDKITSGELDYSLYGYGFYTVRGIGACTDSNIIIPDTYNGLPVKEIVDYAFSHKTNITSITIPNSISSIGTQAFIGCTNLTSLTIPDSVTSIGEKAFMVCSSLTSVAIGSGVEEIGESTFRGCSNIEYVVIGTGVKRIEWSAFEECTKLESVYYMGSGSDWNSIIIKYNNFKIENASIYYYTETEPTSDGNWWHYVDGEPTPW